MATVLRRVLIVEDEKNMRANIRLTLEELNDQIEIEEAEDGLIALQLMEAAASEETMYDLVISDIRMPHMDGETLLAEIKERGYSCAVIMLTAYDQDDLVVRCLKSGACDYLVKPVDADELLSATTNALQHQANGDLKLEVDYDPSGWFEVSGQSDFSVLYRYRRFLGLLDHFDLEEEEAEEVRLALEELGRNAIEWGNEGDKQKRVRLACRILPNKIILQIADEGSGFIPREIPDPSIDPMAHIEQRQVSGKRMGGYGMHLVKNIMDKVVYNSRGNVVVAIKYLGTS